MLWILGCFGAYTLNLAASELLPGVLGQSEQRLQAGRDCHGCLELPKRHRAVCVGNEEMGIWTFKAYSRGTTVGMKMGCSGQFIGTSGPPFSDE